MTESVHDLDAAHRYHEARRWVDACKRFAAADRVSRLPLEDRED
jgi:hypothetical protein